MTQHVCDLAESFNISQGFCFLCAFLSLSKKRILDRGGLWMPPFLANVVWTRARPETSGPELTMLCGCRCSGDRECASGNLYRIWHKLIRNSDSSVAALPCSSFVRLRVANSWGTDLSVNSNKHCATTTVNKPCVLGEIPVLFNSSTTPNCLLMQIFGLSAYLLSLLPGASHTDAKGCLLRRYLTLRATDQASVFVALGVRTGCKYRWHSSG